MRLDSLAFRLTAAAALWLAVVLVVGGLALSSLFRQSVETTFDDNLDAILDSLIAAVEVTGEGELVLTRTLSDPRFQRVYSGWYWQVKVMEEERMDDTSSPQTALRSRSLFDQALLAPSQA
ncbi:MAG: hypothetical protein RLN89_05165, partial [Parvibaculum sp.]